MKTSKELVIEGNIKYLKDNNPILLAIIEEICELIELNYIHNDKERTVYKINQETFNKFSNSFLIDKKYKGMGFKHIETLDIITLFLSTLGYNVYYEEDLSDEKGETYSIIIDF